MEIQTVKVKQNTKTILRVNIKGDWYSGEFIELFEMIDSLYLVYTSYGKLKDAMNSIINPNKDLSNALPYLNSLFSLIGISALNHPQNKEPVELVMKRFLRVEKIKYASPGFCDFTGIGTALGHVKEIILLVLNHFLKRKERFENLKEKQIKNKSNEIKNKSDSLDLKIKELEFNKKFYEYLIKIGYSKQEVEKLHHFILAKSINLILNSQNKISSIDINNVQE